MKKQPRLKINNACDREILRLKYLKSIHTESLTLLAILYGLKFDSGDIKIRDFYTMTMGDVHRELQLRILILKGRKTYKLNKRKEEREKNQQAAIDELIAASMG